MPKGSIVTKRSCFLSVLLLLLLALVMWSPWITKAYAEKQAAQAFTTSWQGVMDGCGLSCKDCGVKSSEKVWFGYRVQLEYACGMLPEDTPAYHRRAFGLVSFVGTVHGFPKP